MFRNITDTIRRDFTGWEQWQVLWLAFGCTAILLISIALNDSLLSIITSLTGICCVILCGMGKISNYFFGVINVLLYAVVAWQAKYYGDVMLNLFYYFPTNIIGWFLWSKNMDEGTGEVIKKRLSLNQKLILLVLTTIGIMVVSFFLKLLGGNLPWVDSASTVLSIAAQFLMIKRFAEQWVMWILVNIASIIMWVVALMDGKSNVAVLLMWIVYLANSIIMYIKWYKESREKV